MAGRVRRRSRGAGAVAAAWGGRRLPRPAPGRRAVAVLATMLVFATGSTLALGSGPVQAQAEVDGWQPCESAAASGRIERVEVLLALDRSGSLQNVDPNGTRRRRAVHATRERLALLQDSVSQLLGRSSAGLDFGIDVALVAFDTMGETVAGLAPAGADHPPDAAIGAALGPGGDTDYGPAVEEALARFESSPNAASGTTCRVLVLFTDGILDPYDTAAGRRPALEDRATAHVSNLLADLCGTDAGVLRYRQRMQELGVSTYVAVLRGPAFDRGAGGSHLDGLARSSKQMILAMTGHGGSPLLGGATAAPGCERWSGVRAGKVIEIENIADLTDELANAVGEVALAVRRPRIRCADASTPGVRLDGEWPHRLALGDPAVASLCTVTAPLDGEVVVDLAGDGLPAGAEWLIGAGGEPAVQRRLTAGDGDLPFTVVSSPLPEDVPVGAVAGAALEVAATWYPEQLPAWPEQPPEVVSTTLRFDVPDREEYWVERLVECRVHQRASWVDAPGGTRALAAGLCTVDAPPAGEFVLALESSDGNRLAWSVSRAVGGGDPEQPARGEIVRLVPGGGSVMLGAVSQIIAASAVPAEEFGDDVGFTLIWRSPRGAVLVERTVADVEIEVRPGAVDLLECGAEAQVTAARQDPSGGWSMVVDTGCRLLSPPLGAVRATVAGDVRGETWQLADPPPAGKASWPTRQDVVLAPSEPDRTLFVGVGHPELAELAGAEVALTLVATWVDRGSEALDEQWEQRSVAVYLPVPRCERRAGSDRVDVEPSGGGEPETRVRVEDVCEIDPPPNGRLEVRVAGAPPGPDLAWRAGVATDAAAGAPLAGDDFLTVDAGDAPLSVGATSGPLPVELLGAFESGLDVYLDWRSARGHSSGSAWRVTVAVPAEAPVLLDCSREPQARGYGGEVPEGPLVVDTGCDLPAPEVGVVTLEVEGFVNGVRWRLPERLSLSPGDADRAILVESAGVLPNEPLDGTAGFELVASLTLDDYEPPAYRRQRDVGVRLERRIRLTCSRTPQIIGAPVEVPDGPLVVDTGCVLLAPGAGTVSVRVDGDVAGVPWGFDEPVRLGPGDADRPILVSTTAPLPNRRYDTVAGFTLAATWRSADGVEQSVGEHPPPGREPPAVALVLRAQPNAGVAALIAVALLLAGLLAGWLVLRLLGRRTNGLPRSGEYRLVRSEVRVTVTADGHAEMPDFDVASALRGGSQPLVRRRGRLLADGLTIRARVPWWNPRDLLDGGRAEAVPQEGRNLLVAASPSVDRPGCLPPSLAPGAVIAALDRAPVVSKPGASQHRVQVWILIKTAGPREQTGKGAARNLPRALAELGRRLSGRPPAHAPSQPTPGPASGAGTPPLRPPGPPEPRPKG